MNTETLALLSAMAPKEPERWAKKAFNASYEDVNPKPDAPILTWRCIVDLFIGRDPKSAPMQKWLAGYIDARDAWERDEWPLIWAKKRLQSVIDSENTK